MRPNRKTCLIAVSSIVALFGIFITFVTPVLLRCYIRVNLVLTPNSELFKTWEHLSELVPTNFYFFNWTNPEDIYNTSVKPKFEQMGPYRFIVATGKKDIKWNDNGTVTFLPQKYWYHDGKTGDLKDKVTSVNVLALATAYKARTWSYMTRKGLSFTLSNLYSTIKETYTVGENLFEGHSDPLFKIIKSLPFFASDNIPAWDKTSWFYEANGTAWYEGVYNVGTGMGTTFSKIYNWNYRNKNEYFHGICAELESSTGDNFDPDFLDDEIKVFAPAFCRSVLLQYSETVKVDGVVGRKYVFADRMLDNGTKFPENECSCNGDCLPFGVFNVSSCRFGSPSFVSLPHFYKADSYYNRLVQGLHPEGDKHEFYVIVEPNTGFPLEIQFRVQLNLMLQSVPGISLYENVPAAFVPALWFEQQTRLPKNVMSKLKLLQDVLLASTIIGISIFIVGFLLLLYFLFVQKKKKRVPSPNSSPEENQQKRLLQLRK